MDYRLVVAQAMKRARARVHLTQEVFADRLSESTGRKVWKTQISEYENGAVEPGASVLVAASVLAGVPLDQLISESDPGAQYEMLQDLQRRVEKLERGEDS